MKVSFLLFAVCAGTAVCSVAQDACNPGPQPDDLVLPMPNGLKMAFRPVYLGIGGEGRLNVKSFTMGGSGNDNFRETPTTVQFGGSFLGDNAGKRDWLFYLGKYEVTAEQFSAVIAPGSEGGAPGDKPRAGLPKTNVTRLEVDSFLQGYNLWLFANARDGLPKLDGAPGFVRLPTEAEWEFAARGGSAVDGGTFDQRVPYSGDLARYEWFSGARSSHDKLHPIGRLEPNALGLHDMLGNAAEMVSQLYQIEYVQGRAGGLIVRGGSFRSAESELRSSMRTEQPLYTYDLRVAQADNIGFRVALASPIFISLATTQQIKEEWDAYALHRVPPMPSALTTAPKIEQTNASLRDINGILAALEKTLEQNGRIPEAAQAKINLIRSAFSDINANILSGEGKAAEGGVRLASIASQVMVVLQTKLPIVKEELATAKGDEEIPQATRAVASCEEGIVDSRHTYDLACQQLAQISLEMVNRKFDDWIAELKLRGLKDPARATEIGKQHYADYFRTKRSVSDQWAKHLEPSNFNSD